MALQVELVSADQKVWSGEASRIVARTVDGDLGVLPGHAPLLAVMTPSELTITETGGNAVVAHVDGGFLSVEHNRVMIVSGSAGLGARPETSE